MPRSQQESKQTGTEPAWENKLRAGNKLGHSVHGCTKQDSERWNSESMKKDTNVPCGMGASLGHIHSRRSVKHSRASFQCLPCTDSCDL